MTSQVHLDRTFAAPPTRVWQALTDPTALAGWFWPAALRPVVECDLAPAGRYRIEAPGIMAVQGVYAEVDPPRRLVFSWRWDGEPTGTSVRLELSAVDSGTRLVVVHDGFPDERSRDDHVVGWSDCLDRLPAHLAG